jgi:cytochrome c oxidase assembly protein subunit 15
VAAYQRLLVCALPLAIVVAVFGAFVRLKDAGLGCPDWPRCYGEIVGLPDADAALARHPDSPLDSAKAWIELSHRYLAAALGLLIAAAAAAAWFGRRREGKAITAALLLLVLFQAILGGWTVIAGLKPITVVAHLLGAMTIIAVLAATVARRRVSFFAARQISALRILAVIAIVALGLQIALGGFVSANYAGLSCPDLWCEQADFAALGGDSQTAPAKAALHFLHRIGALVFALAALAFAAALVYGGARGAGFGLATFVAAQLIVGAINVVFHLPLASALAHNALAALLTVNLAVLARRVFSSSSSPSPTGGDERR